MRTATSSLPMSHGGASQPAENPKAMVKGPGHHRAARIVAVAGNSTPSRRTCLQRGGQHRQGQMRGPVLGQVDPLDGLGAVGHGGQAVDGVGGNQDDLAGAQRFGCGTERVPVIYVGGSSCGECRHEFHELVAGTGQKLRA